MSLVALNPNAYSPTCDVFRLPSNGDVAHVSWAATMPLAELGACNVWLATKLGPGAYQVAVTDARTKMRAAVVNARVDADLRPSTTPAPAAAAVAVAAPTPIGPLADVVAELKELRKRVDEGVADSPLRARNLIVDERAWEAQARQLETANARIDDLRDKLSTSASEAFNRGYTQGLEHGEKRGTQSLWSDPAAVGSLARELKGVFAPAGGPALTSSTSDDDEQTGKVQDVLRIAIEGAVAADTLVALIGAMRPKGELALLAKHRAAVVEQAAKSDSFREWAETEEGAAWLAALDAALLPHVADAK